MLKELQNLFNDNKGQIQGIVVLLALIMVGGVGGIIGLTLYESVRTNAPTTISTNAQLQNVTTTYFPLFIVGIVAGTAIAGLIFAILYVTGGMRR